MGNDTYSADSAGKRVAETPKVLWNQNDILVTESQENGVPIRNLWIGPQYKMRAGSWIPSEPALLNLHFTQHLMGMLLLKPNPRRALMLGVGCAAVPRALKHLFAGEIQIDLVDIKEDVFKVAHTFFGLEDLGAYSMYAHDGRDFIKKIGGRYDLICVDMWDDSGVPDWLLGDEFWGDLRGILEPDGAVSLNAPIQCAEELEQLFGRQFASFYLNRTHNAMLFGTNSPELGDAEITRNADMLRAPLARVGVDVDEMVAAWRRLK